MFDKYVFLPDQAKYSAAQQSVAKATSQLYLEWQIDKKIRDLMKVKASRKIHTIAKSARLRLLSNHAQTYNVQPRLCALIL